MLQHEKEIRELQAKADADFKKYQVGLGYEIGDKTNIRADL